MNVNAELVNAELPPITKPPELQVAIGKGSFGVVWKARDEHGRDVAVAQVEVLEDDAMDDSNWGV